MMRNIDRATDVRHRNNAAEWVMWVAIWPIVMVLKLVKRCRGTGTWTTAD